MVEVFHLVVCFFAEEEESDAVIGFDVEDVEDVRGHKFKYKHYVVTFVQVQLLVLLNRQRYLLLLFSLLYLLSV